ncbi:hypothetical protein G6L63_23470 [Agrobacterium vitis]|nr:hypothetical protein [Agrobacterium vitis]MCF1480482.1 hypothetical protein [Agrobacterium vitis]MUZ99692.1 hypothetical protein [Agrobacterium vitis]MVA32522.1 hypothetical protein [Agrobacterium vitis]NOJ35364.1 hypothetical protein [Agrobacterium vitis]NSZ50868.1 hypothetical protein [Agrobacterium vitis]
MKIVDRFRNRITYLSSRAPDVSDQEHDQKEIQSNEIIGRVLAILPARLMRRPISDSNVPRIVYPSVPSTGRGGFFYYSFLLFVVIPSFATLIFSAFWASNIYVVETKMTVRQAIDPETNGTSLSGTASSILSSFGLSQSSGTAQDTLIVLDYLKSRAVILDVGGRDTMEKFYNRPALDWLSKLGSEIDLEALWSYWRSHVQASVDTQSNILTLKVEAYTPQDAYDLSSSILQSSENLINRISSRNRQDALNRAKEEVDRSIGQLADARSEMLAFQQKINSLDPVETAKQIMSLTSSLSLKRIELETGIASSSLSGATDRPGDRYAKTQLEVINSQIENLKGLLTAPDQPLSVSQQLKEFEILKLRQTFAEQMYTLAHTSFEEARRKLSKQQLYVVVVVPPLLPEEALYPQPFINMALVFFACFITWSIMSLAIAAIKDSE